MSNSPSNSSGGSHTGLVAMSRVGDWEFSVDESLGGPHRWYMQLQGRAVYLYFQISAPSIVEDMLKVIDVVPAPARTASDMQIGTFQKSAVFLIRDDEF